MKVATLVFGILLIALTVAETVQAGGGTCISRRQFDGSVVTTCY